MFCNRTSSPTPAGVSITPGRKCCRNSATISSTLFWSGLRPLALAELASDVVQKFALAAGDAGVELASRAEPGLPLVDADLGLIERVLDNLIDNALQHTPTGGAVRITIDAFADGVRVRVADTGAGIAAADLPHVFDRHWRGGASGRTGGAGLGLAIARRIVEMHGTTIQVESEPAHGTCFTFTLPGERSSVHAAERP